MKRKREIVQKYSALINWVIRISKVLPRGF